MPTPILLDRERRIRSVTRAFKASDLRPATSLAALSQFAEA
jgi:hypothetical protein